MVDHSGRNVTSPSIRSFSSKSLSPTLCPDVLLSITIALKVGMVPDSLCCRRLLSAIPGDAATGRGAPRMHAPSLHFDVELADGRRRFGRRLLDHPVEFFRRR